MKQKYAPFQQAIMLRCIVVLFISIFTLMGCSGEKKDDRLSHIAAIVSESPADALRRLDSIDRHSLSASDRYFHDFLTIKAKDKAYIKHTSDSTFLRVFDYYSNKKTNSLYPEVLYYGGRVYSDLGDYPTALNYFHLSLDCLPPDTDNRTLRNRVLSQTGRLLTSLRLYEEAIPYIESSLEIDRQLKDTTNIIYDLQLLGGTYLRAENYKPAEDNFRKSLELSSRHPSAFHSAKSKMYLAAVKYKTGQTDSALSLIRNVPDAVNPKIRNSALAYASTIYLKAGILDTALLYSQELLSNPVPLHHEIGYQVILSPQLRKLIHPDSIDQYISDYRDLMETFYDENKSQLAINQQNLYNYQLHDRQKAEAEKSNEILWRWIFGFIFAMVIMVIIILLLKNRDKNHIIELEQALKNIGILRQELENSQKTTPLDDNNMEPGLGSLHSEDVVGVRSIVDTTRKTEKELREKLRNDLMSLYESPDERSAVSPVILQSESYLAVLDLIRSGVLIKEDDALWSSLEKTVLSSSPKFKSNLNLLTLGKLTVIDLHTALLIKCGIKPSQMTTLLGKSNGAIISRRESLCLKVLDKNLGVKVIDRIIRLL